MRTSNLPGDDDPRDPRELSAAENADLCSGCVKCCSYLAIAVDSPRTSWEYDQWIWALHHERVAMYVERPEAWFLYFETRCARLDARGRCSIHGKHPVLCREYDPRFCERRHPLSHQRAWFGDAEALETWLARERPGHWKRLVEWRRKAAAPPATARKGDVSWVPLASVGAARSAAKVAAEAPLPVGEEL